jgi:hypothetical protein
MAVFICFMNKLLLFLVLTPYTVFCQKMDHAKFIADARSMMQFYGFERAIQRNEEIAALYFALGNKDWKDDLSLIKKTITEEKKLKQQIQDAKVEARYEPLKKQTVELMDVIIRCFNDLNDHGPESEQFKKSNEIYQPLLSTHLKTFLSYFDDDNYFKIDSAGIVKYRTKAYDIAFPQKQEYNKLMASGKYFEAYTLLQNDKESFNRDVTLMYMADLLLKKKYHDEMGAKVDNADSLAPAFLYKIINKNAYSPFLYEGWRKWRAITQMYDHGSSKTSDIPNGLYDSDRFRLMQVIFAHIEKDPADVWAYVQFFSLQNTEIIQRFGPYEYGNQSALERQELFYKD